MTIQRSVCSACGFAGGPQRQVPGSLAVEIVLWFFFAVPGLIYSLWRLSSVKPVCPACERDALIPYPSERADELLAKRGGWPADAERHFFFAARAAWRRSLAWVLFAWGWVVLWAAISWPVLATLSGLAAAVMSINASRSYPGKPRAPIT